MVRPIVLMAEIEPPEGLSARKLVLETGKFNVTTAYSVKEALETLVAFPRVDVVVLHASVCRDMDCDSVIAEFKKRFPAWVSSCYPQRPRRISSLRTTLSPATNHRSCSIFSAPVLATRVCRRKNRKPGGGLDGVRNRIFNSMLCA